jgi:hypothetical protein
MKMDLDQVLSLYGKILGIVLIVLCPIGDFIFIFGYLNKYGFHQSDELRALLQLLGISIVGIIVGVFFCRREFGWFKRRSS